MKKLLILSFLLSLQCPLEAEEIFGIHGGREWRNLFRSSLNEKGLDYTSEEDALLLSSGDASWSLQSSLIDLETEVDINRIEWDIALEEGDIQVAAKTGNELTSIRRYYDSQGNELSESEYDDLSPLRRGPIEEEPGLAANWSTPYNTSGQPFESPTPLRYLQIQITFNNPRGDIELRSLSLSFLDEVSTAVEAISWGQVKLRNADLREYNIVPEHLRWRPGF